MKTENETPEGCLAFDLEKARAGHPCRTRDGRVARYVGEVTRVEGYSYSVVWDILKGDPITTTEEGFSMKGSTSKRDILLTAPKLVKQTGRERYLQDQLAIQQLEHSHEVDGLKSERAEAVSRFKRQLSEMREAHAKEVAFLKREAADAKYHARHKIEDETVARRRAQFECYDLLK